MYKILLLLLLVFQIGTIHAQTPAEPPIAFQAGKTRLIQKLEANLREQQKQIDELRAFVDQYGAECKPPRCTPPPIYCLDEQGKLKLPISPDCEWKWRIAPLANDPKWRFAGNPLTELKAQHEHLQAQRNFLVLIKKEQAQNIPPLLKSVLLSCKQGVCQQQLNYSEVEDLIAAFGYLAFKPVLDEFKTLDANIKESILNLLLRVEPLQCPVAVLELALNDSVFRVRVAALGVFKKNCDYNTFQQHWAQLFKRETNPEYLLYLLDQIPDDDSRNTKVYNLVIDLIQNKRIPEENMQIAFGKLCAAPMQNATLDYAKLDIPFWLNLFETHQSRQACLVENLFLKLDQEKHLSGLQPLFRQAAEHHYHFSAVRGLYNFEPTKQFSYWDSIPGADVKMLALFKTHLSQKTLQTWAKDAHASLGEKLLISQWLGGDPAKLLPATLQLQLEVRSASNVVASQAVQNVQLNQPFQFVAPALKSDFQEISYSGTVRFDATKLSYRIENFVIHLKPSGAGFNPEIPVTGSFKTNLLVQPQKNYEWRIKLTPAIDSPH